MQRREEIKLVFREVGEASWKFLERSAMDEMPIDPLQSETANLRKVLNERIKELKDHKIMSRKNKITNVVPLDQ